MQPKQEDRTPPLQVGSQEPSEGDKVERGEPNPPIPTILAQSQAAFYRDLPQLLKTHYWKWVAYHGDERIGFGRTQTELYQVCLRRGLKESEFEVRSIDYAALSDHEEIELPLLDR